MKKDLENAIKALDNRFLTIIKNWWQAEVDDRPKQVDSVKHPKKLTERDFYE